MKALFSLAFLGMVLFCAFRIVPIYVESYELQDYVNQVAIAATVHKPQEKPEAVQNQIYTRSESLGLPLERHDIKVSVGKIVMIQVEHTVFVDLSFYTLPLHFNPSAKKSNI